MFWVRLDSQTQFRAAVIYVSLHLAHDGNFFRSFSAVKEEHQLNDRSEAGSRRFSPEMICVEKLNLYLPFVSRVITGRWRCCVKGRSADKTAPITDQNRRKGRPARLHRAYQTHLQQEPQCQTTVMTFSLLWRRPEVSCQQLVSQRRRQTFLQQSDVNGPTRTGQTSKNTGPVRKNIALFF